MKVKGGGYGGMRALVIGWRVRMPGWMITGLSAAVCAMLLCTLIQTAMPAHAGVLADATRVIYAHDAPAQSLMLVNTNDYPVIVQTWVDHGEADPNILAPFVSLPSVFRLMPKETQGIRVLLADADTLPQDRESVFWLNLYEIPPTLKASAATSHDSLALAMNTALKIFYRPKDLPRVDLAAQLRFVLEHIEGRWVITCHNPTPYHASFTTLEVVDGSAVTKVQGDMDMMTAPFAQRRYVLGDQPPAGQTLRYALVDDAGFPRSFEVALTP